MEDISEEAMDNSVLRPDNAVTKGYLVFTRFRDIENSDNSRLLQNGAFLSFGHIGYTCSAEVSKYLFPCIDEIDINSM